MSAGVKAGVRVAALVVACVLLSWSTNAAAQTSSRPRIRFERLSPSVMGQLIVGEDGRIQRLVLLRGQPGWFLSEPVKVQAPNVAPGTVTGASVAVDFLDRRIVIQGIAHDLGRGNLVFVDDMDFTGKRATVSTTTVGFDGLDGNARWLDLVQRSHEAPAFLKCGESMPPRPRNDLPPQAADAVATSTTRMLNAVVCDDLVRLGVVRK
jgi:hypothetical protein